MHFVDLRWSLNHTRWQTFPIWTLRIQGATCAHSWGRLRLRFRWFPHEWKGHSLAAFHSAICATHTRKRHLEPLQCKCCGFVLCADNLICCQDIKISFWSLTWLRLSDGGQDANRDQLASIMNNVVLLVSLLHTHPSTTQEKDVTCKSDCAQAASCAFAGSSVTLTSQ